MRTKQFAISSGIAVLLPFLVHYSVALFSPPPNYNDYHIETYTEDSTEETEDLTEEESKEQAIKKEESKKEKEKMKQENERRTKELEEGVKHFQRYVFFVAYPVGILAIIIGFILPVQSVGTGLMFGGLATLAGGCYSYWGEMQPWGKFISLLIALVILIVLGFLRQRPEGESVINSQANDSL